MNNRFVFLMQNYRKQTKTTRSFQNIEIFTIFALSNKIKHYLQPKFSTQTEFYSMESLDKIDLQILRILQQNSRLTTKELASQVHLSPTPVFERLKRLEGEGYIKRYVAVLDASKLNCGFVVFCSVKLHRLNKEIATEFANIIRDIPEVTECYNISGDYDFLLKIHATDMKCYQEFVLNVLGTIDSLSSLMSTFVMDEIKHNYGIPII